MAGFKGTKRRASRAEDSDEEDTVLPKTAKKTKTNTGSGSGSGTDKDGNPYWELSNKRRLGVSKFKDMTMINIREFFEKDGELLPGKKGISLTLPQYEALLKALPQVNTKLQSMGHDVEDAEDAGGVPTLAAEAASKSTSSSKAKSKVKKSNFEATSDEDEDD